MMTLSWHIIPGISPIQSLLPPIFKGGLDDQSALKGA